MFIKVSSKYIDDNVVFKILEKYKNSKFLNLDMVNVENIKSTLFIKSLLENKFKLYNLKSEILVFLAIVLKGSLKTYINQDDAKNNKRELVNRNFLVV